MQINRKVIILQHLIQNFKLDHDSESRKKVRTIFLLYRSMVLSFLWVGEWENLWVYSLSKNRYTNKSLDIV